MITVQEKALPLILAMIPALADTIRFLWFFFLNLDSAPSGVFQSADVCNGKARYPDTCGPEKVIFG